MDFRIKPLLPEEMKENQRSQKAGILHLETMNQEEINVFPSQLSPFNISFLEGDPSPRGLVQPFQ